MKHKVKLEIEKLEKMLKELKPSYDIKDQAKKIKDACTTINSLLQEYSITLEPLTSIIKIAEGIIEEGYHKTDIQFTLEHCKDMKKLYVSVEKKFVELEKKINKLVLDEKKDIVLAHEKAKSFEKEEHNIEKIEHSF